MARSTNTVLIHRPVEDVFAFFTTPGNDRRWRTHVISISADGPVAVGSRISQSVAGPGGRTIPADIEVTGCEPYSRYSFTVVAGPVRPSGDFRFSAEGDHTRVEFTLSAELSGVKKLLMGGAVQRSMDAEVAALVEAKRILEAA
ncbi:SRPBCC family protein [Microbacterium deminutum]|uniref:Polyketide cyclase n=1 Tax=Microbacterium deminutum TaxID=344164 RepID=A0ABN2Q3K8_9MICO